MNVLKSLKEVPVSETVKRIRAEHERLIRDNPTYRAEYEKVCKMWDDVFSAHRPTNVSSAAFDPVQTDQADFPAWPQQKERK